MEYRAHFYGTVVDKVGRHSFELFIFPLGIFRQAFEDRM